MSSDQNEAEWVEFESIFLDTSFKLAPHQFEDIDIWAHEFTEDSLYDLIMEYTGWTEFHEGMLEISWDENRTVLCPLWHLLTWLHGIGSIEGRTFQGDEVADKILKNNVGG